MVTLATSRRPSGSIPTSSMADIAFLLLVFFLVTTVFPKDKGLSLVLPNGTTAIAPQNVMHLLVRPNGMVEVRLGANSQGQVVAAKDIAGLWRSNVTGNPKLIAAVEVDPDAAYERMMAVLDQLQTARAERVSLELLRR
jgi:biopolymer transport protein ExbD